MAMFAVMRGDAVLWPAGPWQPRAMSRALDRVGLRCSFGAAPPAASYTLADGDPGVRMVVVPDRPAFDPDLSTCAWDAAAGQWVVTHGRIADMRQALVRRSHALCRAGVLAGADEDEQRNAALGLLSSDRVAAIKAHITAWRRAHADHVAAIAALDDAADLAAYDLTAGWPEGGQ